MEITIKPTIKQHQAYQAINTVGIDEVFFGGGAGGGKSWSICESRLINALRFPGYKSFIGRNELKRLMQSTYQTWLKVCTFHKIPKESWTLNGQYNFIKFINESRIDLLDLKFMPAEDPLYERFGSLEFSDGAIEEAGEVHPLARQVLKSRVNRHRNKEYGINPCLLDTGNPKKNWTYQTFYKPWKEGTLPHNMRFIQALYRDNPFTSDDYGRTLSQIQDKVMRARLRDGNWEYEDDPATLMKYESIVDMFSNAVEWSEDLYLSADIARYGEDKTVVMLWRGWQAFKVLYREKQGINQTIAWIKELARTERIPYSHIVIDEDGVGGGVVDELIGVVGFTANATALEDRRLFYTQESKNRFKRAYSNLKTQCGYILADKVNNHEISVKTEDVSIRTWITEDLEQIKEQNVDTDDKKRRLVSKDEAKEVLGRSPDFGDTLLMRGVFDLRPPLANELSIYIPDMDTESVKIHIPDI